MSEEPKDGAFYRDAVTQDRFSIPKATANLILFCTRSGFYGPRRVDFIRTAIQNELRRAQEQGIFDDGS